MRDWIRIGVIVDKLLALPGDCEVTICADGSIYVANASTNHEQRSYREGSIEQSLLKALQDYGVWELI